MYVAENSGASDYRVSLLNGLIATNSGMHDEALRFAKEALAHTSSEGDSQQIGAHALLAAASIWAGYTDLGELEQFRLRRLSAQSDTDCLLQAYATVLADPHEAMRLLETTPRIQRAPVGLFIRANADNILGQSTQHAQRIDQALPDLEYVQFLFRDNKATQASRLLFGRCTRRSSGAREAVEGRPTRRGTAFFWRFWRRGRRDISCREHR